MNRSRVKASVKEKEAVQLLKLEQLFHSQYMTEDLLNEMVALYVKFSENISQSRHPIKFYFMQKIRYVLSRPEIIRILDTKVATQDNTIKRLQVPAEEDDNLIFNAMTEQAKQKMRQNHLFYLKRDPQLQGSDLGEELKIKERNMKIELQLKIMEEVEQNIKTIDKDFENADKKREENKKYIHTMVNRQDESLNQRLASRKKNSRNKSACCNDRELSCIMEEPPMPKEMLLKVQSIINENYERFTRRSNTNTPRSINIEKPTNLVLNYQANPYKNNLSALVEGKEDERYQISVRSPRLQREEKDSQERSLNRGHNPEYAKAFRTSKMSQAPPGLDVQMEQYGPFEEPRGLVRYGSMNAFAFRK